MQQNINKQLKTISQELTLVPSVENYIVFDDFTFLWLLQW